MAQEIESVKPILTVIDDEGDLVLSSTGPKGKAMAQAVLATANDARKITAIFDGEMKVLKRNAAVENVAQVSQVPSKPVRVPVDLSVPAALDIQEAFISDLEAGITGEVATGEVPAPLVPPKRRKPVIFQDAAAPPAPELAEAEMDRLLQEAADAEKDAARVAEDRRFQAQQAIQAGEPVEQVVEAEPAAAQPRKRQQRQLATTGRPCGRCGGGGKIVGDAGFEGSCPVCHGEGQVKTWDRSLKVR
jgi:hypothetical protein